MSREKSEELATEKLWNGGEGEKLTITKKATRKTQESILESSYNTVRFSHQINVKYEKHYYPLKNSGY